MGESVSALKGQRHIDRQVINITTQMLSQYCPMMRTRWVHVSGHEASPAVPHRGRVDAMPHAHLTPRARRVHAHLVGQAARQRKTHDGSGVGDERVEEELGLHGKNEHQRGVGSAGGR